MSLNDLARDAIQRLGNMTVADAAMRVGVAMIVLSLVWLAWRPVA